MEISCTYEKKLLQDLQNGDQEAFTILYQQYSVRMYYNILALVKSELIAEELVQDVFTRIWQNRASIQIEKSFAAYLFVAGRNSVYDFFQKVKRDHQLYSKLKNAAASHYSHIEESIFKRENMELLQKAISALPPQRKRAFELCKMQGLSYQEASKELGVSLSTLKDHMANAFESIRRYVAKNKEVAVIINLISLVSFPG